MSAPRLSLEELVDKGRTTVQFLREIAARFKDNEAHAELARDCARLAVILESAVDAIALYLKQTKGAPDDEHSQV